MGEGQARAWRRGSPTGNSCVSLGSAHRSARLPGLSSSPPTARWATLEPATGSRLLTLAERLMPMVGPRLGRRTRALADACPDTRCRRWALSRADPGRPSGIRNREAVGWPISGRRTCPEAGSEPTRDEGQRKSALPLDRNSSFSNGGKESELDPDTLNEHSMM